MVDTSALEKQIDKLVYALYGLTLEEIAIVEGENGNEGQHLPYYCDKGLAERC